MKQCDQFVAIDDIRFQQAGSKRVITIKQNDVLTVTSTEVFNNKNNGAMLGKKQHHIGQGYFFSSNQIETLFKPI